MSKELGRERVAAIRLELEAVRDGLRIFTEEARSQIKTELDELRALERELGKGSEARHG